MCRGVLFCPLLASVEEMSIKAPCDEIQVYLNFFFFKLTAFVPAWQMQCIKLTVQREVPEISSMALHQNSLPSKIHLGFSN